MMTILVPLTYLLGALIVEARDPAGRRHESRQHAETWGERHQRNLGLIDHARQSLVDHAVQNERK